MRFLTLSAATAVAALIAGQGLAETRTFTLTNPEARSNPPEGEEPALTTTETSSIGDGAWTADPDLEEGEQHLIYLQGDLPGPYNGQPKENSAPGANPNVLFPDADEMPDDGITFNDLVSVSFDTNSDRADDWFVNLLTDFSGNNAGQGADPDDSTPEFDLTKDNLGAEANGDFTTYTFDEGNGVAFRNNELGGNAQQFTLEQLKDEYGDNEINFVSLGTNSRNMNFAGAVDNFRFSWLGEDGETVNTSIIDFEAPGGATAAIPVPAALPLLAGGIGVLAGVGRLRRKG